MVLTLLDSEKGQLIKELGFFAEGFLKSLLGVCSLDSCYLLLLCVDAILLYHHHFWCERSWSLCLIYAVVVEMFDQLQHVYVVIFIITLGVHHVQR